MWSAVTVWKTVRWWFDSTPRHHAKKSQKNIYYCALFFDITKILHYNINVPPKRNANLFLDNHIIKYNTLTTRCRRLVWRPGPDQKKQNMWDAAWSSRDRWIYWINRFTYPNQVRLWLVLHDDYLYKQWLSWRDKWLRSDASRRRMVAWETIVLALKTSVSVDVQWCAITRDVSESSRIGNEGTNK